MQKSVKICILGHVQNVFFRYWAKIESEKLGITGFAKNNPDGTLTIVATGKDEMIKSFIAWCKKGPEQAQVETVNVIEIKTKNFVDFTIH